MKTSLSRQLLGFLLSLFCLAHVASAAPPTIITQPTDQAVDVGSNAQFVVQASGTPPLHYQWQFGGTNLAGGTNTSLTITNVQPANTGTYAVVVTNRFGSVTSSNAVLTLGQPPTITIQPSDQTVAWGGMAGFSVAVSGTAPLKYQWRLNGTNLPGATNISLTLTNVKLWQAGSYTALVTNTYGAVLSSNAVLTVTVPCAMPPSGLMGWWRGESNALDSAGGNNGSVTGGVSYVTGEVGEAFAFDGTTGYISVPASPALNIGTGSGLTIECWIKPASTNTQGPIVFWTAGLQLWVQPGLQLFANIKDAAPYYPNDHMVFAPAGLLSTNDLQHVALTYDKGSGIAVIYLNGIPVVSTNLGSFNPETSLDRGPLNIGIYPLPPPLTQFYSGLIDELSVYSRALSQNEIQSIYNAGSDGKCPAPVITVQPISQPALTGTNITLSVSAGGMAPLIYQWTFGGTNIAGATNASLALNNIQPAQSGNYAVWVANDYGSALSSNAVLAVGYPPTIITDLTNEEVLVGGTAIFSVTAIGLLPLHYQWSFGSGYAPGDTNTLTVTNVQYAQTGSQVLVYITNPLGFTFSSNVVLTVALPPSITAQPVDQTVPVGSPVSFGVTVQGTEPLSYQWRLNGTKVAGATNGTLTIPSAQPTNAGIYSVVVTNRYGSVTSSNAQLTVSGTGGGCANPPFGLVSWWPAEGNANDIIGGNNGTLLNGVTFTNGEVGLAFAFQGGDDGVPRSAVQIPYSPTLTTAHFSVETWINPVSQVNNGDNRSLIFGESYGFVQLIVQQGVNGVVPAMLIANSSGAVASTNEIPIGQFTHVVATWNGTALRLYLNGAFNNQSVPGGQPSPSGCPFYIGGFNHPDAGCQTLSQYFNGLIDEVSYYSRALADSEIKALYQAGSLGKCSSIPPVVASQPASQTVYAGGATSFTVAAGGSTPLSLQWVCNGTNVTGATNSSLSLTNVQFSQAGTYNVGITNAYGSVVSSNASLTVLALAILTQPADQAAVVGQPASFSVIADSVAPLHYQWRANGTNIIGSTNATLNLAKAQFSQAGNYAVLITNIYGSLLSSNAVLRVNNPGTVPVCDLVDLQAAVAVGGPITFGCDGVITLTSTLNITKPTSLDAAGHHVTISGGNAVRLFYVAPGVAFSVTNLLLANGLCLGNNGTAGTPADGGAIYNDGGAVTLVGCTVTNNSAQSLVPGGLARGGAIFNNAGTVSLYQTSLSNNATIGQGYNDSVTWINGIGLGGAIYNTNGSMAITGCNVSSNFCYGACTYRGTGLAMGGAAFQASGFLTVTNSVFAFNQVLGGNGANNPGGSGSPAYGGALAANGGSITIQHSQFLTNTATGGDAGYHGAGGPVFGGAVYSTAILSAADSSFSGNQALAGNWQIVPTSGTRGADGCGGAIYNSGLAVLSRCSVCSNLVNGGTGYNAFGLSAADGGNGLGGGIFNDSQLLATNCTAALNSAVGGMGHGPGVTGTALGGGVFNNTNAVFVALNLTLASNSCSSPALSIPFNSGQGTAAGSQVANTNGTLRLQNSILAYSTNSDAYGTILDNGYNLCSDNSAGLYAAGSHNNTNPLLGPLGDYGGPTLTMPLLVGSPAIDGGSTAAAPPVDQRGHARPYGAAADIGAFESSPPYFIGGQVAGPAGFVATVTIGSSNLFLSTPGSYGLEGFAAGSYTVTPSNSTFLFVPASSLVTVGPDQLAVNFNAYRSNYLSMEAVTNGMVPLFFAAPTGQTYRTLTSSNLLLWVPIATNTLGPTAYFRIFVPMTTEPGRFYRTVSP